MFLVNFIHTQYLLTNDLITLLVLFLKKIHDEQQKRRMLSLYPHRMSRKGYANLENEWVSDNE